MMPVINYRKKNKLNYKIKIFRSIIILLIFLGLFSYIPDNTEGALVVVTSELYPSLRSASVRPNDYMPVFFFGNISIGDFILSRGQQIDVAMNVESPGDGWSAVAFPPLVTIKQGAERKAPFRLLVLPSMRALHGESKTINITGTWMLTPSTGGIISYGLLPKIAVKVVVEQFYRLSVEEDPPLYIVWPGAMVKYDLVIKNQGNGWDSFDLEITNEEALMNAGYAVEISDRSVDIGPRNQTSVEVIVYGAEPVFHPWRISSVEIAIRVTSEGAKRNHVYYEASALREASFYYNENGPSVREPVWGLILILIVIIVSFYYIRKRRYEKWQKKKARKRFGWDRKKKGTKMTLKEGRDRETVDAEERVVVQELEEPKEKHPFDK